MFRNHDLKLHQIQRDVKPDSANFSSGNKTKKLLFAYKYGNTKSDNLLKRLTINKHSKRLDSEIFINMNFTICTVTSPHSFNNRIIHKAVGIT